MGIQINGQTDTVTSTTAGGSVTVTPLAASGGLNVGTGASISSPATNVLTLGTNNSERVRINSSGAVGLGTANPQERLHNSITANNQNYLRLDNPSGTSYYGLNSSGDTEINAATNNNIIFKTFGTERSRITSTGNVQIANGNLVFSTAGTGIDFSATANSSGTMTSELLSDYERGTWTPSFVQPATSANMYVNNGLTIYHADYVKIGNLVYVSCYIQNDASFSYDTGRSGTDSLGIGGLPFTVSNTPTDSGYHPIYVGYFSNWTSWSASYTPMGYFTAGTNNITLVYAVSNGITNITATYMYSPNSTIILSGWYRTDS